MNRLAAILVLVVLIVVSIGSFGEFFTGLGWDWATFEGLFPGGAYGALGALTVVGCAVWIIAWRQRDG